MMNLRAKLSCLRAQSGGDARSPRSSSAGAELQRRLARIRPERITAEAGQSQRKVDDKALAKRLTGYALAEGVILIQQRLPFDSRFGRYDLNQLRGSLQLPGEGREAHLRQLYVDTETTGLSGGSGTLAFLIGQASVEPDALVVSQYLLTRFAGEAAMLAAFAGGVTPDDRLVSYNGKCFDLPLLTTRYRMQGEAHALDQLAHLDLLHAVRRLFGKRWPDCRLTTLEERLLGFRRQHDLPGAEAPAAWTDYIRQGRAERLIRVVEHNRQDLVSLALAHAALVQAITQPHKHGVDIPALALWLSKFNSEAAYTLLKSTGQVLNMRGKRLLGQMARRAQDWELAIKLWQELANRGCEDSLEQLAKYHEHVSGNLAVARRYSERLAPGREKARRLQRIEAKQYRETMQATLGGILSDINPDQM
jgi:uncharacterized protein YprB with RNaseH-like and TPR domain